ncbi:type II toxin-antitoxin system VapC family toxin [Pseudofrankia inefficax]|uniref:Ribonuclease VapC n=1 Tax=Pseudofrankia inefficax (strain DSM 45817 / CECT 9037 / DDB 130130 / EuI1c) TaxID=298654 RepID=E3ITR2_PSEI1|nr:type II toxin-antitoxin system VapC family toxin [Pseudofrankia inefficax]ADP79959.1 PilT protein domain protein [Pseudofrankia inefficax]
MTAQLSSPVVLDASAAVALLTDAGPAGTWVAKVVDGAALFAPELMPFEAANILRRHLLAGILDPSEATLAHADLLAMPVRRLAYASLADRAWDLRANLTAYDAAYVALAEALPAPLVTLDARLGRASGPRCEVLVCPEVA